MKRVLLTAFIIVFALEIAALVIFNAKSENGSQSVLAVNEVVQTVRNDWEALDAHTNKTELDYVVINKTGEVLFRTAAGLSENVNSAVSHRDTILDVEKNGELVGKIIIYNNAGSSDGKNIITIVFVISITIQCAVCVIYTVYLNARVIKPFGKLKGFAERVAGGNLDIPLEMDKGNLFGAFTESFDIMRSELKKARLAEAKANASKKELVAKLSHDIRTPVASIKAVSELGAALAENDKTRGGFAQIVQKSDQITTLVDNLFSAALEELQQLSVSPADMSSAELRGMLESADYLRKAQLSDIPERMIFADKLRLQQVFDNIFANSYKYANTEILVNVFIQSRFLAVEIEDFGGGVTAEELPLLKEKFGRGSNTRGIDGAGLGLYISSALMTEMNGELHIENGEHGLKLTVLILLSGNI